MGIVVIGAVFVDIKGYPLSTYIPGGRNAGRIEQVHGGVSRNVAEDIANVELRPTFVGLVDDTGMGQDVIDKLDNHKVNTRYIQKVPDGMGTWLAIFDNDGDVHAAISKRPDTTPLTTLLEEKGDEIFRDCDAIAIELDLEKDTVKQVLRYARKYNKKVFAAVSNMSIAMERRDYAVPRLLRFPHQLRHDAHCSHHHLPAGVPGHRCGENRGRGHAVRQALPPQAHLQLYDKVPLPHLCGHHPHQLGGKRAGRHLHVSRQ